MDQRTRDIANTAEQPRGFSLETLPLAVLCIPAILIVCTYFTLDFVRGTGAFWEFPRAPNDHAINDMAQCLSGYLYYMTAPWRFPLFYAANFGVPEGTNIALMDAVPAMALIAKILYQVFGVEVNLLGLWTAACYVLTGAAFGLVMIQAGIRHPFALAVGIAMAVMWPPLLLRISHVPLLAWFPFLLALAAYFVARRPDSNPSRIVALQIALTAATLFLNIYLTFMTAFFAAVTLVAVVADRRMTIGRAIAFLTVMALGCIATMLLIGQISFSGVPAGSGGFGIWSFNLLSPFAPQFSGLFPGSTGVDATGGQYEGFGYLGGGCLLLLAATLIRLCLHAPSRVAVKAAIRRHWVLFAACIALTMFAASNRVFVGDWNVVDIWLPWKLTVILGAFRSSGRYFWPVSMIILLCVIVYWVRFAEIRRQTLLVLLAAALALQWFDTAPMRELITTTLNQTPRTALERGTWARLIQHHRFVRVYPTVDCIKAPMSYTQYLNSELQLFAAQQKREINIMNTSRPGKDCAREAQDMDSATIKDGGLYVFLNWSLRPEVAQRWRDQPGCRSFDYGVACTRDWGGLHTASLVSAVSTFYERLDPVPWQRKLNKR